MTTEQAARIERLLKLQALQMHSTLTEIVALGVLLADSKDAKGYMQFVKSQTDSLLREKQFLTKVMDEITEDERAENKAFEDELMAGAIEELKRRPVGFKP